MSFFDFRGHRVWYESSGAGPAMVFLHNGGNDHRIWDFQAVHFARTHRVILVDHLGFGNSDCPEIDFTLPLYTEQVAKLIETLKLDRVILVGHCIGGAMALNYTLAHPERVENLVLFNVATEGTLCAGPLAATYRKFHNDPAAMRTLVDGIESAGMSREVTDAAIRNQFGPGADPGEEFLEYMHRLWNQKGQMRALYGGISRFDTFAALDNFVKPANFPPTFLLWGGTNNILPKAGAAQLGVTLRPDQVEYLDGCGHMAMRDRPAEVNAKIEAFVSASVIPPAPSTNTAKSSARRLWALLAGMALGVLFLVPVFLLPQDSPTRALLLAAYVSAWPAQFIYILLHEAGHALAAVSVGFRLFTFTVSPLKFQRVKNGWRLSYWADGEMPGFISAFPASTQNVRTGILAITIAGPATSLVTGLAFALFAAFGGTEWSVWLRGLIYMTAFLSIGGGVLGFLPIRQRHIVSDGLAMRFLKRGGPAAERECSLLLLAAASIAGQRPREWDADLIRIAEAPEAGGGPHRLSSQSMRYNWLIDTGQINSAEELLTVIVESEMPPQKKAIWQLQMAWFKAFYQHDLTAAREWSGKVSARLKPPELRCARLKTDAAIALLEHRWSEAETAARGALNECDKLADIVPHW